MPLLPFRLEEGPAEVGLIGRGRGKNWGRVMRAQGGSGRIRVGCGSWCDNLHNCIADSDVVLVATDSVVIEGDDLFSHQCVTVSQQFSEEATGG